MVTGARFAQPQPPADPRVLGLLSGYMKRTIYDDGLWRDSKRGISLGCPLSPLMGALYLKPLDDAMAESGLFYARFMDDWVVLAPTRWKLRKAVALVNKTLNELNVWQHPDKTYMGRVDKGFDFLGYRFGANGLTTVAQSCIENRNERITRLYEQGADDVRIGRYVQRWHAWARGGLRPHRLPRAEDGDARDIPTRPRAPTPSRSRRTASAVRQNERGQTHRDHA